MQTLEVVIVIDQLPGLIFSCVSAIDLHGGYEDEIGQRVLSSRLASPSALPLGKSPFHGWRRNLNQILGD